MKGINLFGVLCIAALMLAAPVALVMESHLWPQALLTAVDAAAPDASVPLLLLASGGSFAGYHWLSYRILDEDVSKSAFAAVNAAKRLAVVAACVAYFHTPVRRMVWIGGTMAVLGTYMYAHGCLQASAIQPSQA